MGRHTRKAFDMIKLFSFLTGKKRAVASPSPRSDHPAVAAPSASSTQVESSSMPSQYDPQLAILLAGLCEQTYVQYQNGPPPANNGKITVPQGYTQVASFIAPEIPDIELSLQPSRVHPLSNVDWAQIRSSAELRAHFAGFRDVYFGFALTSAKNNIIALRGTRTPFEW